jgi:hypothetical protein
MLSLFYLSKIGRSHLYFTATIHLMKGKGHAHGLRMAHFPIHIDMKLSFEKSKDCLKQAEQPDKKQQASNNQHR